MRASASLHLPEHWAVEFPASYLTLTPGAASPDVYAELSREQQAELARLESGREFTE